MSEKPPETEFTPWSPRINPEKIPLDKLLGLDGKVATFTLNGNKHSPDGREYSMVALVTVVQKEELEVVIRSKGGSVIKYKGERLKGLLDSLYSVEEVEDTTGMEFPEIRED